MFTPEKYESFKDKFKELDRVFDTAVKKSARIGSTVYMEEKILSSYPREYLDYYMVTRQVLLTPMPGQHRLMRPRKECTVTVSKRYVMMQRLAGAEI